jgi:hypothetical protein
LEVEITACYLDSVEQGIALDEALWQTFED